jgi:hypothetical protein
MFGIFFSSLACLGYRTGRCLLLVSTALSMPVCFMQTLALKANMVPLFHKILIREVIVLRASNKMENSDLQNKSLYHGVSAQGNILEMTKGIAAGTD